jgi:integrase
VATKKSKQRRRRFGNVRKLPSGRFQASYKRSVNGVVSTYYNPECFLTEKDADAWLLQEQLLVLQGTWTVPGVPHPSNTESPTFGAFARRHLELQTNLQGIPLKPSTREKYLSYLDGHLKSFEARLLEDITKDTVDEWWSRQVRTGKVTTASKAYKLMHAVFSRAIKSGFYKLPNPCQIRGAQNAVTGVKLYTPTISEVTRLANSMDSKFRMLTLLSTFAALRFGEVTALRVGDLSLKEVDGVQRFEISVSRSVTFVGKRYLIGTPKSLAGEDSVVISSDMTPLLQEYLESLKPNSPEALLFSDDGGFIPNHKYSRVLKTARKSCGLWDRQVTPHSLRRAGATEYANQGANVAEVQKFLRDSSPKAALAYIQATNRTLGLAELMKLQ